MVAIGVLAYIPSLRHQELLQRTLRSIREQQGAPAYTLTIIGNGNESPATQRWLTELAHTFQASVIHRGGRDIAGARDQFLREHCGELEFCAFVDSDVELPPNWLQVVFKQTQSNSKIVGVATVNRPPANESNFNDALLCFFSSRLALLSSPQALQLSKPEVVTHLSSCAVLYHRPSVLEVGGYNLKYSSVGEDLELSYRLKSRGQFLLLAEPKVVHRQDETESRWFARMFRYGWGQIEVMRDHSEHARSLKALPPLAMAVVVLALLRAVFGGQWDLIIVLTVVYLALIPTTVMAAAARLRMPLSIALRAVGLAIGSHVSYALGSALGVLGIYRNP